MVAGSHLPIPNVNFAAQSSVATVADPSEDAQVSLKTTKWMKKV